jgi:hypothetical protein
MNPTDPKPLTVFRFRLKDKHDAELRRQARGSQ